MAPSCPEGGAGVPGVPGEESRLKACATCGTRNDSRSLFCVDCGDRLPAADGTPAPRPPVLTDRSTGVGLPSFIAAGKSPPPGASMTPPAPSRAPTAGGACSVCGYSLPSARSGKWCPGCGHDLSSARVATPTPQASTAIPVAAAAADPMEQTSTQSMRADPALSPPPASESPAPAGWSLVVVKGGERKQKVGIGERPVVLGRTGGDLTFPDDPFLSPTHARVAWRGGRFRIEDMESHNGVYLRIEEPTLLRKGDLVCLGGLFLRYEDCDDLAQGMALSLQPAVKPHGSGRERARGRLVRLLQDGSDGPVYPLIPSKTIFGRKAGNFVFPDDLLLSRQHAQFYERDGDMAVEDLGSSNGTLLRIRGPAPLDGGTVFRIGEQTLEVVAP